MRILLVFVGFLFSLNLLAQNGNMVFNDSLVHTLYIKTELPNWFDTLDNDYKKNVSNRELYPQRYFKCDLIFDGLPIEDCGIREKGNASNLFTNFGKKKPLKIAFDEFSNQSFDGLKKLNLNNFTNDPSLLHDVISFRLMRKSGIPAPRTSFLKVWIDEEYIGLYLIIENVDKTFLKAYYGKANNDGNLYKTDRGAQFFMNWLGFESVHYKNQNLQLTTNEKVDDWSRLIDFVYFINNDYSDDFKEKMDSLFDIHSYLKILAIEKLVRSWDSYWGGGNNFFLYEHPDGKIRWIPWDMNETFQEVKWLNGTNAQDGYLVPTKQFDDRPLLKRIFEVEEWKQEYLDNVCTLIDGNFSVDSLGAYTVFQHELIDSIYKEDPYRYNTYESFQNSLTDYNEDAVSLTASSFIIRINYPGIYPFIQKQREWAIEQMQGWEHPCMVEIRKIHELKVWPNPALEEVYIENEYLNFEYASLCLHDITGNLIGCTDYEKLNEPSQKLSLVGLPAGVYVLTKHFSDGSTGKSKIVKLRN